MQELNTIVVVSVYGDSFFTVLAIVTVTRARVEIHCVREELVVAVLSEVAAVNAKEVADSELDRYNYYDDEIEFTLEHKHEKDSAQD